MSKRMVAIMVMLALLLSGICSPFSFAETERDIEAAKAAALGNSPDLEEPEEEAVDAKPARPTRTVYDLTQGGRPPRMFIRWQMGPTGIRGIRNDRKTPTQLLVDEVLPGSPADGKVLPGDVVVTFQGRTIEVGENMNRIVGDAIIAAETEAGGGDFALRIWRDRNFAKRVAAQKSAFQNVNKKSVDVDTFEATVDSGEALLYAWEEEEKRKADIQEMATVDEVDVPIDGFYTNIALKLEVMGTYSETSPWDCPVVQKMRDNALAQIAARVSSGHRARRWNWQSILALVGSGKPEYVELAKRKVREMRLEQDMDREYTVEDLEEFGTRSYVSWMVGFDWLEMAIYYDATGDDHVLPEIRRVAILTAMGQNGGGSWGHKFSVPSFNGGRLHRNNPGYGAMNNAGSRCFFLLALAKKAGIEHPEIDAAIARASRFFKTYLDKGCIPYGYHSPYQSDDSNGKNYGAAYAFYALGDIYAAKFFGLHSSHASFSRRGGHGSPVLWYYTPLSGHLAGPRAVQASMQNMRYFYTLSRSHDGNFIFLGDQIPGIGGQGLGTPTEMVTLHLLMPLQQLMITGKGAEKTGVWATDEEYEELIHSAIHQVGDAALKEKIGSPWWTFDTARLIGMLDHFMPKRRREFAKALAERYAKGERDILPKMVALLDSPEARMRDGACLTLAAMGADIVQQNMNKFVTLLHNDPHEFVRMTAARTIAGATQPGDKLREVELLRSIATDYPGMTMDHGNLRWTVKGLIMSQKKGRTTASKMTTSPFQAGYDEDLVRRALENLVTMDPQGAVPGTWDKETLLKLAGPVTFAASEFQINDAMFGGYRKMSGQALLRRHGYREAIEGTAYNLLLRSELPRGPRRGVKYKDGLFSLGDVLKAPGLFRGLLDDFRLVQWDNPLESPILSKEVRVPINQLIAGIERDIKTPDLPTIGVEVQQMFQEELKAAGNAAAQLARCRMELSGRDRKNYFRKMYAMTHLAETLGARAIDDISPLLGHEHWRVREHAERLAVELIAQGAGDRLVALFLAERDKPYGYGGNWNAAGMLNALAQAAKAHPRAAQAWSQRAQSAATQALKHPDTRIRAAALSTVYMTGGGTGLQTVLDFLQEAKTTDDFYGVEQALLIMRDDPEHVARISQAAIKLLPRASKPARRALAWVLAQFGGPANLQAIQKAVEASDDDADRQELIMALAYSPDRGADDTMVALARANERIRKVLGKFCLQRMVGPGGVGDVSDAERVKFARGILNMMYNDSLVRYLQFVYTPANLQLLSEVLMVNPRQTARSLIAVAEGIKNPSKAEVKQITDALTKVIEYIEVNHLRGGFGDRAGGGKLPQGYAEWKAWQTRASKLLLQYNKVDENEIPPLDDMNLML